MLLARVLPEEPELPRVPCLERSEMPDVRERGLALPHLLVELGLDVLPDVVILVCFVVELGLH